MWKDGIRLWSDVLNKYPSFVTALNNRGNLFAMDKEYDLALSLVYMWLLLLYS